MKILIGMPSKDSWGGPISSEPPFVDALKDLDTFVVESVYVYGDKEKPTPLLARIRRVVKTALRFRRLIKRNDFDVIHLNTAFDRKTILRDSFSLFVMRPGNAKVFLKFHGSEAGKFANASLPLRLLIGFLKRKVDGFGVHTREELADFENLGFDRTKFHFVKNAVTIHENREGGPVRGQKEKRERFELLFVSRFISEKGLIETIEACRTLKEKNIRFVLYCVGDGESRGRAERKVAELALGDEVRFTGYIPEDEVSKHFFERDIFVFPTQLGEGFPNVLFKALSVGMPVVTTRVRAAVDYLEERENCLFCAPTAGDIAEKLIELIEDKELRESMSRNNSKFGEMLLPKNIAKEFLAIYESMVGNT